MLIFTLVFLCLKLVVAVDYVATSSHEMARVLQGENDLLKDLRLHVAALEQKLNITRLIINDALERQKQASIDPVTYIANPLTSLPLMRRMHEDVPKIYKFLKLEAGADLQHIADYNLNVITNADLEEAVSGFVRIQQTYDLKEMDMARGLLSNKQYNAKLNTLDCLAIAQHLHKKGDYELAIKWLKVALHQYEETPESVYKAMQIDRSTILKELAKIEAASSV